MIQLVNESLRAIDFLNVPPHLHPKTVTPFSEPE